MNWYKDDLYSTPWNFSTDIVTVNLTLYAKWELKVYEISYDGNDATGGSAPEVQFKNHGENLTLQNNSGGLYKTDFIFYGWNTDKNGTGTHYDEGDIYKENSSAVLFAEWATPHDVSFDLQGHGKADINPVTVAHGSKVEKPEDPTDDEGWTFRGWYKEPECINMWIFNEDKVISDVTLFALWTFNEYEVTIDTTYGFLEGDAPAGWNKTSDTTYVSYFAPDEPISSIIAPWLDVELKCSNIFIHVDWDKTSGLLEEDTVISAKWSGLAYQVCVWGIDEDDITGDKKYDKTVTFGPAVGSSANCLDVKGDHEGPCIHDMSWDDIIKDCNNGDTEKYRNCLNCGCTATVSLNINSSLGYMPDDEVYKFSTLYSGIIKDDFLKYNLTGERYNDCSSARWDMSRMRATLNGREGMNLSRYAGSDCLYFNKCLLSCFPSNLQSAIKPRFSEIASSWRYDGSLDYHEVHTTVNDKLWLGEHSAFGSRGLNYSSGHGVYSKWYTSGRYIGSCYDHNNQYCRFWLLNVQMEFTFAIATWSDRIASMSNEVHGISPYFVLGTTSSN